MGVLLVSCATPEQKASRLSSPTLCYVGYAGDANDNRVATQELARRGFTCTPEALQLGAFEFQQYLNRRQASSDAAFAAGIQLLTPPAPPPPAQHCQWQTNANGTGSMSCH